MIWVLVIFLWLQCSVLQLALLFQTRDIFPSDFVTSIFGPVLFPVYLIIRSIRTLKGS